MFELLKSDTSKNTDSRNWEAIEHALELATKAEDLRERSRKLREASRLIREKSTRISREALHDMPV
jgi:hypothetical protein